MSRNPKYTRLMSTSRWTALRWQQLRRKPVCERCASQGKTSVANEVHHIVPLERASTDREMERFCYDPDNLMSVCRDCHRAIHEEMFSHSPAVMRANKKREANRFAERYLKAADADAGPDAHRTGE